MTNTHKTKVIIVGSGPAGLSAAIYAARANLGFLTDQGGEGKIKTSDWEEILDAKKWFR